MTNVDYILAFLLASNAISLWMNRASRLQDIERKLNLIIAHLRIDPEARLTPSDRVIDLASDPSQRIAAIKAYRDQTGAGLKEALAVIDKIASESRG